MSLIPPAITLSVGIAMVVLAYHGAERALPELDEARERGAGDPDARVENVPWTIWVIAGLVGGVGFAAIGLLWLVAALVVALVR